MRAIEYRAWHKKKQQMCEVIALFWRSEESEPGCCELLDSNCTGCPAKIDDVELMQYTGLLDKKGTKIFEGDIVSIDGFFAGEAKDTKIIKYEEGAWNYSYQLVEYSEEPTEQWEVIGNVWEHPSLLGATEKADKAP